MTLSEKRLPPWKDEGDDYYRGKDVKEFIRELKMIIFEEEKLKPSQEEDIFNLIDRLVGDKLL